jgi:hypothetical protein
MKTYISPTGSSRNIKTRSAIGGLALSQFDEAPEYLPSHPILSVGGKVIHRRTGWPISISNVVAAIAGIGPREA